MGLLSGFTSQWGLHSDSTWTWLGLSRTPTRTLVGLWLDFGRIPLGLGRTSLRLHLDFGQTLLRLGRTLLGLWLDFGWTLLRLDRTPLGLW
jgi:hypothetical protein